MNTIQITETQGYQQGSNVIQVSVRKNKPSSNKVKPRTKIVEPVQPIKDLEDIQKAKTYLLNKNERYSLNKFRDYCLFVLSINICKRIGDVLKLTVDDILTEKNTFRKNIYIITDKKEKQECFTLSPQAQEALSFYFGTHPEILENRDNGLFPTRESNGKSMNRKTAWDIFKKIETEINKTKDENSQVHIATHSGKKTFGYQAFQNNLNNPYILELISNAMGHDSITTTRKYLGFDAEELSKLYTNNGL